MLIYMKISIAGRNYVRFGFSFNFYLKEGMATKILYTYSGVGYCLIPAEMQLILTK
jgi:hypothetical protein